MRLFEFEDRFGDDLATVLRNLIGRSDSKKTSMVLSYPAISSLMKNMGYGSITFDSFDRVLQNNPELQSLVKNHNEEMVELSTVKDSPQAADVIDQERSSPDLDQMAFRAARAELK